jgi:hypothetical protein
MTDSNIKRKKCEMYCPLWLNKFSICGMCRIYYNYYYYCYISNTMF